ncbi:hypothetical protein OO013_04380 [Mangrovivirga sp. M17]|uniref:STAS/SEC14 domain-containing protein n=1 Tax=Mangrovivirga halotolerans TaxID=2993936 RepID=A0ABT3RMP8_9BACT|nr:hypothetical protein [Mangrovivirga halotolerans]MCX2743087.1 hypothetical protein [Mangrovivirga halotolerans]
MEIQEIKATDLINEENVLFEEPYVTAYYSKDLKIAGVIWDGFIKTENYTNTFDRLIKLAEDRKVIGFYSDIRKQGVISIEARKYFESTISPKAKELGVDKTGIVSDSSPFKKYYINTIIKMTGRPAKIFSDPDKAINFILE